MKKGVLLSLLTVLLLSLPWLGFSGVTLLVAFVPLLILQEELALQKSEGRCRKGLWHYLVLIFALWWGVTTFWVGFAAVIGVVAAMAIGVVLNGGVFLLYHAAWRKARLSLAYTILVTGWISYELLYTRGEISFPWLILGNGFANDPWMVQWYEYTGVFGGSLWVLIANLLFFEAWKRRRNVRAWIAPALVVLLPMLLSLVMYLRFEEAPRQVEVEVVQPNFDPYDEKFELEQEEQNRVILGLMATGGASLDYVLLPETALSDTPWEDHVSSTPSVLLLRSFLKEHSPGATLVTGATTRRSYSSAQAASATARSHGNDFWYDVYNSALVVDTTERVGIHHKSILVAGVEKIPYYGLFKHLEFLTVDLGGISGQLGVDSVRKVFTSPAGVTQGTAICYESIYGQYFTEFVRNGAQVMFIITNDGWWGDTPGYRNHFSYARLRAIETRRDIARSANTGISGFINARGDVGETLGWDVRGALSSPVGVRDELTIYVRYGDVVARASVYLFLLSVLYFVAYLFRKRGHLVD